MSHTIQLEIKHFLNDENWHESPSLLYPLYLVLIALANCNVRTFNFASFVRYVLCIRSIASEAESDTIGGKVLFAISYTKE